MTIGNTMGGLATETWRGIPTTDPRIRILIADDQPIIRKQVRSILEEHPGFEVCGEVQDGARAIEESQRLKPDVLILNISMPVLNGLEAARQIKVKLPDLAIVILSSNADKHFVEEAKKVGARCYVAKDKAGRSLVNAVKAAVTSDEFVLVN